MADQLDRFGSVGDGSGIVFQPAVRPRTSIIAVQSNAGFSPQRGQDSIEVVAAPLQIVDPQLRAAANCQQLNSLLVIQIVAEQSESSCRVGDRSMHVTIVKPLACALSEPIAQ